MRRYPIFILLLASCGSDQWFAYDLEPIELARAPIAPGGATLGGLLANVATSAGIQPLLVDSAYPINSFAPAGCAGGGTPGWTYTGNVRELRNCVERAVLISNSNTLTVADIDPNRETSLPRKTQKPMQIVASLDTDTSKSAELEQIQEAISLCAGNQTRAAALLGIARRTLVKKLATMGLPRPRR